MNIFIYGLINPLKNRFFYIGQTNNLARRFSEHLVDTSDSVKACEMQQLRDLNLVPSIVILEVANEQTANAIEQKWIDFLLAANTELTNAAIANYSSSVPVKTDRWIDKLSLNSTLEEIGAVFLDFSFGIKKIYRLHDLYFIMTEKTCERIVPAFSNGVAFQSFLSTIAIETNTRSERELVKFISFVVNNMKGFLKKKPNILPFNPLCCNIEDAINEPEHYNRIQHEFYTTINIEQFLFAFKRHYGYLSFNEFRDKYYSLKAIYDVIPENMLPNLNLLYNQT